MIYLLLYLDDMLIECKSTYEISQLKKMLGSEFEMKDLGATKRILGIDIKTDRVLGVLTLSQFDYVKKVLKLFSMETARAVKTPITAHFNLKSSQ